MKPAPMPWILCGPFLPPLRTGEAAGSTATALKSGLSGLMYCAMPVIVPPVPTPATTMSTLPSVSFQISGPVVSLWIFGFAKFLNCCGTKLFGVLCGEFFGFFDGAAHAVWSWGEDEFCAVGFE